ncbi:unnamed protein product [Dicrocoelium dendriticum]|nr:unnamed protein product [Dicrocoelium dendriticum]
MSGNVIPRALLQAVSTNGLGRYIPQLQRVTIKFCKARPDTVGVRDYIEKHLVDFARRNPATVVYVKPRRRRPPLIVAEYLCGNWQYVQASMMDCDEVYNWMELLRNRSGLDILPIYKKWSTKFPSIQGMWHPFYHDQTNGTRLLTPEEIVQKLDELSQPPIKEVTAEDRLIELSKKQQQRIDA